MKLLAILKEAPLFRVAGIVVLLVFLLWNLVGMFGPEQVAQWLTNILGADGVTTEGTMP